MTHCCCRQGRRAPPPGRNSQTAQGHHAERIDGCETEEKKTTRDDIRDVTSESKATATDVKARRTIVRLAPAGRNERAEQATILETYMRHWGCVRAIIGSVSTRDIRPKDGSLRSPMPAIHQCALSAAPRSASRTTSSPDSVADPVKRSDTMPTWDRPEKAHRDLPPAA